MSYQTMADSELDHPPRRSLGDECRIRQEESGVKPGVDMVNHPPHYGDGVYEPIKVIEAWELDYCLGNCVKYVARHKKKNSPLEDLKKARWYLDREIQHMEADAVEVPQFLRRTIPPSPYLWKGATSPKQGDILTFMGTEWRWAVVSNGNGEWVQQPDRAGPPTPK